MIKEKKTLREVNREEKNIIIILQNKEKKQEHLKRIKKILDAIITLNMIVLTATGRADRAGRAGRADRAARWSGLGSVEGDSGTTTRMSTTGPTWLFVSAASGRTTW